MNAYKFPYCGRPFKGNWYYELQVGPIVLMWQHDMKHKPLSRRGPRLGRFYAWWDKIWFFEIAYPVRRIMRELARRLHR